jgi:outer membrane protein assembly factor BamB
MIWLRFPIKIKSLMLQVRNNMMKCKKLFVGLSTVLFSMSIAGCGYIDDYAFGKDNTPHPKPLPTVEKKQVVHLDWSVDVGSFPKGTAVADLQPFVYQNHIYAATANGNVISVNKKTGALDWRIKNKTPLLAGPVVNGDDLAINTDASSVILLDRKSGKKTSEVKIASDALAKPLLIQDRIYLKTINGMLYSINLKTGKKKWTYEHGSPEIILKASSSPAKYGQTVVVGFSDGELIGFDEHNGHIQWQRHIAFARGASDIERLVDIDTNPIIDGSNIYIATYQGEVGCYSIDASDFIWHKSASTYHDLAFEDYTLVMVDSKDTIWAFNKNTGQVLWKQNGLRARGLTAPVIWNHQIWVGDKMGVLHGIDIQSGDFIGQISLPGSVISAPVVERGVCWVLTTNGQLHRLSMSH